jgi:hypothetical protein
VKGGELHGIMAKLEKGLSWIGRRCGGLPTVSREVAGEELKRRRWIRNSVWKASARESEMEGGEATEHLRRAKKGGGGKRGRDGGEVAAGQSSGRGGATWSARKKARGEKLGRRAAWGRRVGAARAGGGAGRAAAAVSGGGLRRQSAAGGSATAWCSRGKPAGKR